MAGKMSQNKGKSGEREIVAALQPIVDKVYGEFPELGQPPRLQRNTLQSDQGGYDIVGLDWFAPEVKRHEILSIPQWWRQTVEQAGEGQEPVLFYRQSRKQWTVVMRMFSKLDPENKKRFFCKATIAFEDFKLYFEHRLRAELKLKAESIRRLPGAAEVW